MKIAFNRFIRWGLFALYLTVLFTLPVTILGSYLGLGLGLTFSSLALFLLLFRGEEKVFKKLNLTHLSLAEAPEVHHLIKELSRRLNIPPPKIAKLKTESLNIGVFGLSRKKSVVILTEGLLKTMSRPQLSALLGRELTAIWYGDTFLSSWFSRFLAVIEQISLSHLLAKSSKGKRFYSLQWVLSQIIFLPIALIPQYLLLGIRRSTNLDLESLKLTQLPKDLAESYRLLEVSAPRNALRTPWSLSPLFLLPPTTLDPISKLIFSEPYNSKPLASLNKLRQYT